MRYKFTLLQDLPNIKKGTVFKCRGIEDYSKGPYGFKKVPCYAVNINGHTEHHEVGGDFDNPTWYKKEIDEAELMELTCPKCSAVRGVPFDITWYNRDLESDEYGVQYAVGFECVCGHKRILYGTPYGIRRLQEQLENS